MADLVFMMGKFEARLPIDRRYCKNHMWCQDQGAGSWRFGFSSYAMRLMQDVYFLEWTVDAGVKIALKEIMGNIETSKAVSDLYAPTNGVILEWNADVLKDPSIINADHHGTGWLFTMKTCADHAMTPEDYHAFLDKGWENTQRILKGQMGD
jgi:glycine cleavage system H protein